MPYTIRRGFDAIGWETVTIDSLSTAVEVAENKADEGRLDWSTPEYVDLQTINQTEILGPDGYVLATRSEDGCWQDAGDGEEIEDIDAWVAKLEGKPEAPKPQPTPADLDPEAVRQAVVAVLRKEMRDLIARAIGALENPADLTGQERQDVIEDLQAAIPQET